MSETRNRSSRSDSRTSLSSYDAWLYNIIRAVTRKILAGYLLHPTVMFALSELTGAVARREREIREMVK